MDSQCDVSQQTRLLYQGATQAFDERNYAQAGEWFSQLVGDDHLFGLMSRYYAAESFVRCGLEQMKASHFPAAVESFSRAIQYNPKHESLPQYLVGCFYRLRKLDRAIQISDRDTDQHPDQTDPRIRLALTLWSDGQQEKAIHTLREGLLRQPQQAEWYFQLGLMYGAREEFLEAVENLNSAIRLKPDHCDALVNLALCHSALSRHDRAVGLLTKAQQLRPADAKINLWLAMALRAISQTSLVPNVNLVFPQEHSSVEIGDLEELIQMVAREPDVVEAFIAWPELEHENDIFALFSTVLDRALTQQAHRAELHYHRARIHRRMGNDELAIRSCERAVEIDPRGVQALIALAKLYRDTDRNEEAEIRLRQVRDMGYEYADVYYMLGCIYRDWGWGDRARESYDRAIQINTNYRAAREALESLAA